MDEAKNVRTKEEIFLNIFQTERVMFRTQIVAEVIRMIGCPFILCFTNH